MFVLTPGERLAATLAANPAPKPDPKVPSVPVSALDVDITYSVVPREGSRVSTAHANIVDAVRDAIEEAVEGVVRGIKLGADLAKEVEDLKKEAAALVFPDKPITDDKARVFDTPPMRPAPKADDFRLTAIWDEGTPGFPLWDAVRKCMISEGAHNLDAIETANLFMRDWLAGLDDAAMKNMEALHEPKAAVDDVNRSVYLAFSRL